MNVAQFHKKLMEVLSLAQGNGGKISQEQVEKVFREEMLSQEQMEKVYDYLAGEKIQVAGRSDPPKLHQEEPEPEPVQVVPLNREEQEYLRKYEETLEQLPKLEPEELDREIEGACRGEEQSCQRVVEAYMPRVAELAQELHSAQMFLGDMISEGNIALLMAVRELSDVPTAPKEIEEAIRRGIESMVEEQDFQKRQDQTMVNKVARLEAAIKEVTDDGELQFSIDELSVFLDMTREEIEDILRLTGEGD